MTTDPSRQLIELVIRAALEAGKAIMNIYTHPETDWQVERKADNSPLTLADRRAHEVITRILSETPYPILSEEGSHRPYEERKQWDTLWIVDPLDGTKEFLKRNDEFTVNIALVRRGSPILGVIYAPALYRLYVGGEEVPPYECRIDPSTGRRGAPSPLPEVSVDRQPGSPCRVVASRSHLSPETETYINTLREKYGTVDTVSAGSSLKLCLVAAGRADVYPRLAPTMEWDTAAGDAIARAAGCKVTDAATGRPLVYNKPDLHNPFFIVQAAMPDDTDQ